MCDRVRDVVWLVVVDCLRVWAYRRLCLSVLCGIYFAMSYVFFFMFARCFVFVWAWDLVCSCVVCELLCDVVRCVFICLVCLCACVCVFVLRVMYGAMVCDLYVVVVFVCCC